MATWQEIGIDNFHAAVALYDGCYYRNATSRFYYAVFSVLTYELAQKGVAFRLGRQTPAHAEMAELIVENLTQFTETRRVAVALVMLRLYRLRLDADYSSQRLDRRSAEKAKRDAERLFRYFGVKL